MKIKFLIVVGLFYSMQELPASSGRVVKVAAPILKAGVIGADIIAKPTVAESYQSQNQKASYASPTKNYIPSSFDYTPAAAKSSNFNYASKFTDNKMQNNKSIKIDLNRAFEEPSLPAQQEPIVRQNQQKNITANQAIGNPISSEVSNLPQPTQLTPLQFSPSFSSVNVGGRFALKGIPKTPARPQENQLRLTYDEHYQNPIEPAEKTIIRPVRTEPAEKTIIRQIRDEETPDNPDFIAERAEPTIEDRNTPREEQNLLHRQRPVLQRQVPQQRFDIDQIYIDEMIQELSQSVESWNYNHTEFITMKAHDNRLQKEILTRLNIQDEEGVLQVRDAESDFRIIDGLVERYRQDHNVIRVLQATRNTIQHQFTSQQTTPRQTNNVITYYYKDAAARNDVFTFMNREPIIDQVTQTVTNMPSVEDIIQKSLKAPTSQAYKALQSSLEATNIAIYACQDDHSFFGDGSLLTQLKTFKNMINQTLQDPKLTQFQSWSSYATQKLSSAGASAFDATIGKMSIGSAASLGNYAVNEISPYATGIMSVSGVKNMTLSQVAEKTGLISPENRVEENIPAPLPAQTQSVRQALNFDMNSQDLAKMTSINKANSMVTQYYTPAMKQDLITLTGRTLQSMPTVRDVITIALDRPSQEGFNALQSTLKATRVALYAHQSEKSMLGSTASFKQLQSFEQDIMQTLQDPRLTQFHSWTSRATSYATSFIPSVKTVLDTTGLGDMTVGTALRTIKTGNEITQAAISAIPFGDSAYHLAKAGVIASGVPDMTISQALGRTTVQN